MSSKTRPANLLRVPRGLPVCPGWKPFRLISGGPFLRLLALPIADQCTTRHVGTRNALNGRLLVRPRVQIGFDANRDNGMQLRFLLVLPSAVTKGAFVTNVYLTRAPVNRGVMKNPAAVSGGVPGGERPRMFIAALRRPSESARSSVAACGAARLMWSRWNSQCCPRWPTCAPASRAGPYGAG